MTERLLPEDKSLPSDYPAQPAQPIHPAIAQKYNEPVPVTTYYLLFHAGAFALNAD